ncbi:MAG: hypothetical protein IT515_16735 [Burkholderiales bacterium]|nr:hypothetical protein [Burkholderiales bacterium]
MKFDGIDERHFRIPCTRLLVLDRALARAEIAANPTSRGDEVLRRNLERVGRNCGR